MKGVQTRVVAPLFFWQIVLLFAAALSAQETASKPTTDWRQVEKEIQAHNAARLDRGGRITLELLNPQAGQDRNTPPESGADGDSHSRCVVWGPPYAFHIRLVDKLPVTEVNFICDDYPAEACPRDLEIRLPDGTVIKHRLEVRRPTKDTRFPRQTVKIGKTVDWLEIKVLSQEPGPPDQDGQRLDWGGLGEIEVITTADLDSYKVRPDQKTKVPEPVAGTATPIVFRVRPQELNRIDARLFGQFMERPSWGEIGPEGALTPGTSELQPAVLKLLEEMKIPIVRFPGGTDVDYLDWRDMVSNVPGRDGERPVSTGHQGHRVTNRFGYDEFLRLAERLHWEVILCVNLRDALLEVRPMKEAARRAAELVAYCNAPSGARLPEGMSDWPALRIRNGHEKPYGVKYVQLGNEIWGFEPEIAKRFGERRAQVYADCIAAYEQAIHAVDPSVKLIIEDEYPVVLPEIRRRLGDRISYLDGHFYAPGGAVKVIRDGAEVPMEKLTAEQIWYAWVAATKFDADALAVLEAKCFTAAPALGYKVAVTEWNWNGGWGHGVKGAALDPDLARGLGAAGFLHALMRRGDVVEIATQSMLVGNHWPIAAILADPKAEKMPRANPSGLVTALYAQHHGDHLLAMETSGLPTYGQPLEMEGIKPTAKVALIDALATADGQAVYWHAINRGFDRPLEVTVDLSALGQFAEQARLHVLEGLSDKSPAIGPAAHLVEQPLTVRSGVARVTLPPRSVVVLEVPRK